MKKLMLGVFLILGAFVVSAQSRPSITIVNNTGYDIYEIYVSPSDSDDWGDDLLDGREIENGKAFTVELPIPLSQTNVYDIGAIDEDDDEYAKYEVTITNNARIVLTKADLE